jgi:uncharacterized delta-60 repeat protein
MRYLPDGIIDDSFGVNGVRVLDISEGDDRALDVFVNEQDEIFVTGATRVESVLQLFIGKLLPDGELDLAYGVDGFMVMNSLWGGEGWVIRSFPNGKVVSAGSLAGVPSMIVTDSAGTHLSTGIGFGWLQHTDRVYRDMTLLSDTLLIVVGDGEQGTRDILLHMRDQEMNTFAAFGMNGAVVLDPSEGDERGTTVTVDPDGRILVGGNATDSTGSDILLIRLMADGSLDNSFGTNGVVLDDFGIGGPEVQRVLVQPDGRIIVLVYKMTLGPTPIHLFRFLENGDLDPEFGDKGHATISIAPSRFETRSMLVVDSCRVLVTGTVGYPADYDAMIAAVQLDDCGELPTSLPAPEAEHSGLICFPNPTSGSFTINAPSGTGASEIIILDMTSKVMHRSTFSGRSTTLDLDLTPGPYLITHNNGDQRYHRRLIVQ